MYESRSSIFSYIRLAGFSEDRMYERQNVGPDDFLTSGLDCIIMLSPVIFPCIFLFLAQTVNVKTGFKTNISTVFK